MAEKLVACVAAMCDGNRGIGYRGDLPWPSLPEDFRYYTSLCRSTRDPKKKNGVVKGRLTWEGSTELPDLINVVVTSKLCTKKAGYRSVVGSVSEALDYLLQDEEVESIYLLGGARVYQDAFLDPRCSKLFLTRVFQDFPSDTFFPPFEQVFHRIQEDSVDEKVREENGVRYRFEVWERIDASQL